MLAPKCLALLLCLLLTGCVTTSQKNTIEEKQLQKPFNENSQQPQALKTSAKKTTVLDQDLNFLIAELDQLLVQKKEASKLQLNQKSTLPISPTQQTKQQNASSYHHIEFGIHIASYQQPENLKLGWYFYQQQHQASFQDKKAMTQRFNISGTPYWRLIVAPYDSAEQAQNACKQRQEKQTFCLVVSYKV